VSSELCRALDRARLTPMHFRIWALSAMGIFLDGFDLFIIGVAMPFIVRDLGPSSWEQGLIAAAAAVGAMIGAFSFGRVTDRLGRKAVYLVDVAIFVVFAIASGLAWDVWSLIVFRFCLGVGVGADYPISASYVSEIVPARNRGRMLIGAFSFQAVGAIFGALVGLVIIHLYPEVGAWRWMLAVGAVPAAITAVVRLSVPESPRWLVSNGRTDEALEVTRQLCGADVVIDEPAPDEPTLTPVTLRELFSARYRRRTLLATVPWFFLDIATYGIGLFTPTILAAIAFSGDNSFIAQDIASTKGTAFLDLFLVVGFLLAILFVERAGRIRLQVIGFAGMAAGLTVLGFTGNDPGSGNDHLLLVVIAFGLFNVLMNMGPNSTTYTLPAELFPSSARATAHGLAASVGKAGAVVGLFVFPIFTDDLGISATVWIIAGGCVLALAVTTLLGIETKGQSLEDLTNESPTPTSTEPARVYAPTA
jgi:MFS family permease